MQINWFTVIAQIINFLILVWLLKRFLYKPILKGIEDREKLIAAQLDDAKVKKEEAGKEQDLFQKKNQDFDAQRTTQMNTVAEEVKTERQKLLDEATNESNALRSKLGKAVENEEQNINQEMIRKIQEEVFAIARKTFTDLASQALEEQAVKTFIGRVVGLKEEQKKRFITAFGAATGPVIVQSAFELPALQRGEIEKAVKETSQTTALFQYETRADLVSGIEMTANGYKLSWNISDYLGLMQKSFIENNGIEKGEKENVAG